MLGETRNASAPSYPGPGFLESDWAPGRQWRGQNWSRQKSLVLRRGWPVLLSEPDIGMVPILRIHLSSLPPPSASLLLFSPSRAFLTQLLFFLLLLSSPVELRAGGPTSFSVLAVHNFRKPCCFYQREGEGHCSEGGDLGKVGGMSQEWETDVAIQCSLA